MIKNKIREANGLKIFINEETYNEYKGTLQDQINELQNRIDKAIEHLTIKQARYINEKDYILNDEDLDAIMNILKGSDNND